MKSGQHLKFFERQDNRLLVTLVLSVLYPVCCACVFAAFVFVILPVSPIATISKPWLYIYWIAAAGIWLLLLAIFLPLMRSGDLDNVLNPVQSDGINLKRVTLMGSEDLLRDKVDNKAAKKSREKSTSDDSEEELDNVIKAEKETLLDSEFKSSPFQQRPYPPSSESPPRERIIISSDLLNESDFSFDDSIVKVHAADDCTYQERSQSTDDLLNKARLFDRKNLGEANHKNLSSQNLRAISRENIKTISLGNISRVTESKVVDADERVEALCEKIATEVHQSKLSGRKFKIDIVKSETVYEYSLPTPEPLSPNSTQNTVFLYVNKY